MAKLKSYSLLATILIVYVSILQVNAITKCRGVDMTFTEEQVMHLNDCLKEAGLESVHDVGFENAGCFSKCVMVKKGLIDAEGKPHKEKVVTMYDASMPEDLKGDLGKNIGTCLDGEGDKIDMKEEDCSSFIPLAMCVHGAFTTLCSL